MTHCKRCWLILSSFFVETLNFQNFPNFFKFVIYTDFCWHKQTENLVNWQVTFSWVFLARKLRLWRFEGIFGDYWFCFESEVPWVWKNAAVYSTPLLQSTFTSLYVVDWKEVNRTKLHHAQSYEWNKVVVSPKNNNNFSKVVNATPMNVTCV